jgi:signal transduction histidine kinase
VTIARGHLEVLRRTNGRGDGAVDVALDELGRMERLLDRLLLLARADQPNFLEPEAIQLDQFLEDAFMRWTEVARRVWRLGRLAPGTLSADPEQLRAALDALLENAVKYSDVHDEIELTATARGRRVTIEVRDTGIGIPEEAASRIFDRFSRADAARTRAQGGVGLGLAIVDAIAKAHGGRAGVRRLQRGSLFSIDLPGFVPASISRPAVPAGTS